MCCESDRVSETVIFKGKWRSRDLKSSKFSGLAPQGRRGQQQRQERNSCVCVPIVPIVMIAVPRGVIHHP